MNKDFDTLLAESGMRKTDLARELGVNRQTVSKWRDEPPGYAVAFLKERIETNRMKAVMRGIIEGEPFKEGEK